MKILQGAPRAAPTARPAPATRAAIRAIAHAVPRRRRQMDVYDDFFAAHYGHSELAERIFRNSGVATRHGVVDPAEEDISSATTGERMRRFVRESLPLGREAIARALERADVDAGEVGLLAVVSCTGYATPGLDILLARELGMPADVQRLHIGHMGCYAAIPGLAAVSDAVVAREKTAVLLCLELPSLHVQPPTDDAGQMVAHALFADAASAAVLTPVPSVGHRVRDPDPSSHGSPAGRPVFEVVDIAARTDTSTSELMTWDITDHGFRMSLSPRVPAVLRRHVRGVTEDLLAPHGLSIDDVAVWAVHPGGPRIVEVVTKRLGLTEDQTAVSQSILSDFGNCSSATVMLILERQLAHDEALREGDHVVAMAFGPGLTLYMALLRVSARTS